MAAGLGFKDFTTGEVLTAADVDGYLMQGIWVFATTAARDAAVTAPAEGNFAFTKDTNSLWYYDGAAWVASGATGDIEGVTAGVGISGGGTSGTVTVTNSMATAIDAKGDLVAGTGADTFSKLTVGANDTVLTADSTTATGLKWATAGGGLAPFLTHTTSGSYLRSYKEGGTSNARTMTEDVTYYTPIYLPTASYDRISLRTGSTWSGDVVFRLGLYNVGTNGKPSTVAFDAGTVNATAGFTNYEITISQSLTSNYYYLAVNAQTINSGSAILNVLSGRSWANPFNFGALSSSDNDSCFEQASVTGAFATATSLTVATDVYNTLGMRLA